jgi:hypothetical protein
MHKYTIFLRDLEEVKEKIASGEFILVDQHNGRSKCWDVFQYIRTSDNIPVSVEDELMTVRCKVCLTIKNFKSTSGTKNLLEHFRECTKSRDGDVYGTVDADELDEMTNAFVKYCAIDLKPYYSAKGRGMIELIQTAVDIQSNRDERLRANDLIPHPSTISRRVPQQHQAVKIKLKELLQSNHDANRPAFSLDGWQDVSGEVNKNSF